MTIHTAFGVNGNGATGPSTSLNLGGAWVAGLAFKVTSSGYQLAGYGQWITNDGTMTTDLTFALWEGTGLGTGTLVADSAATISTLTPGTWQYVSLGTPIPLTSGTVYKAVVCSGSSGCLAFTTNQFGAGDPYVNGITNGPLTVFSSNADDAGTNPDPFSDPQFTFNESQSDPTAAYPASGFNASNGWVDVQITAAGGTAHTATAALTVTPSFSAARARGKYRTGALTVTPSFSAARTRGHGRAGSLIVVPAFSAARSAAYHRHASLLVTPGFTAIPSGGAAPVVAAKPQGGWYQLLSIIQDARQSREYYDAAQPMACPRDGEPFENAPTADSGSDVELYCRFCGFHYPRDWDAQTMSGF